MRRAGSALGSVLRIVAGSRGPMPGGFEDTLTWSTNCKQQWKLSRYVRLQPAFNELKSLTNAGPTVSCSWLWFGWRPPAVKLKQIEIAFALSATLRVFP